MKKQILLYSAGIIAVTLSIFFIYRHFNKLEINSNNPEFAEYISAYTTGSISKAGIIQINLTPELSGKIKEGKKLEDLISFSPSIEGKFEIVENVITFKPEKYLPSGKEYFVVFNLGEVAKVKKDLNEFVFKFKTIEQDFDFEITEQKTTDKKTLKLQQLSGVIHTADIESLDKLSKAFEATQDGKKLEIKWTDVKEGTVHYFTIDNIIRSEKKSKVIIKYDGEIISSNKKGKEEIEIPAIGDFYFISAKVVQQPDQYLQLQFSDPLDPKQNLNGLITISKENNIRLIIEDNVIKVFTQSRISELRDVTVRQGIKNILGYKLKADETFQAAFEPIKPQVKFIGDGNILPSNDKGLILPFEAVSLIAIDVTVYKIYENNVMQFLQVNEMDGESELRRVAKPLIHKKISLEKFGIKDFSTWNTYSLSLNELIDPDPGAIYRIEINFKKSYSTYSCTEVDDEEADTETEEEWGEENTENSNWDYFEEDSEYYDDYYYYDNWEDRDDPCKKAYYGNKRKVSKNILASDIGIIAKVGNDKSINVFVSDIKTAKPKEGVIVEVYDYQQQLLVTGTTDDKGIVSLGSAELPYFVTAKIGNQRAFLKLSDGNSLSLSRFDVAGTSVEKGLKGFIYGERGVWRPGDSLFLTFVLKEQSEKLPEGIPIVFEFTNPSGQVIQREVMKKNLTNFYVLRTKTNEADVTGNYNLKVKVGTVEFNKTISIETVKPNRLKINFEFAQKIIQQGENLNSKILVKWLHGVIGKDLKVTVDASLKPVETTFAKYTDFTFDDPTKTYFDTPERIFEGTTNDLGEVKLTADITAENTAPGKMNAIFFTKAFEKGGNFSVDYYTIPFSPYKGYTGIKLPKGDKARGMLLTDTTHRIEVVTLTPEGNLITDKHEISFKFYKIEWKWWWDQASNSVSEYNFKYYSTLLKEETIKTSGGKVIWNIKVKYPDWGRYLVVATDNQTGHSTGKIVYIDWPGWAGRAGKGDAEGASMLVFTSDKQKYNVGESAKITFPSAKDGRAIINIENGTKVIETHVVETKEGQSDFILKVNKNMAPNVFVNITLLQKHSQTANDLPLRMYGVIPLMVEDPKTRLNPVITMPNELEADKDFTVKVSEKNNLPMTYTLAIVDEGLLDLTRFSTPSAWDVFFAREALGVKTWDLFDQVIGAYSGKLERLLAIGGSDDEEGNDKKSANRFVPVVKFIGPFTLKSGSKTHTFKMSKYIGSVRTMVVAGSNESYGSADKTTKVIKPLMILGTLPRILGPKEKLTLPVSIFSMKKDISNVKVTLKITGPIKIVGNASKNITFKNVGEENLSFDIETENISGIGKIEIIASSGNYTSSFETEIDVRNPNPVSTEVLSKVLNAGETWNADFKAFGIKGTNNVILEVSSIPAINLAHRLEYLITYPHGCIEQTTSSVFPQLYLNDITNVSPKFNIEIQENIKAAIKKIASFQLSNGGFSYWPGGTDASEWGTNYAGHFLLEAKTKAYPVPAEMLNKWRKFQDRLANNWTDTGNSSQLEQAYRLYTLALAGYPNKGAMNRLKEIKNLSVPAKWRLAAAYSISGNKNVAVAMIEKLPTNIPVYNELSFTFGSDTRDKAMILETLILVGQNAKAFGILKEIAEELSKNKFMSTQTTAYSLFAVSSYLGKNSKKYDIKYSYSLNSGKAISVTEIKSISQNKLGVKETADNNLSFKNISGGILYARIIAKGIPEVGYSNDAQNGLSVSIKYSNSDGSSISPENISQGTDFIAEITVTNTSATTDYKEMALSQIFPAGWEIINTRLYNFSAYNNVSIADYQDIRDDRVYSYFDIKKGQTKTFAVMLNASYEGHYWMPAVSCEAMYDGTIFARKGGTFVTVDKM